jgi:DNA-binding transcriptional ArsR family regulator
MLDPVAERTYLRDMSTGIELAEIGALTGDPARGNMLALLLDGRAHAAKELSIVAGVSPQTASWHLGKLSEGQLLASEKQGRRRYYRLASPLVAQMLETMLTVAGTNPPRRRSPSKLDEALRNARTCYDHLAGKLGVAITNALARRGCLVFSSDGGELTSRGVGLLGDLGVDVHGAQRQRRAFCRPCLDWTERRPHLAGSIGAGLTARCFELGWIARTADSRAVLITQAGRAGFAEGFGIASP